MLGTDALDKLGHHFNRANLSAPTRCEHCHLLLLGLTRQGLACDGTEGLAIRGSTAAARAVTEDRTMTRAAARGWWTAPRGQFAASMCTSSASAR